MMNLEEALTTINIYFISNEPRSINIHEHISNRTDGLYRNYYLKLRSSEIDNKSKMLFIWHDSIYLCDIEKPSFSTSDYLLPEMFKINFAFNKSILENNYDFKILFNKIIACIEDTLNSSISEISRDTISYMQ